MKELLFDLTHCHRLQKSSISEIVFHEKTRAKWVVAPVLYTERLEQLVDIEITEGESFDYKVLSNFRGVLTT